MAALSILASFFFVLAFFAGPMFAARLPFIIGGVDVTSPSRWPWQGSLRFKETHLCGCALLSSQWAVTAAQCLGAPPIAYELQFGSVDRTAGGEKALMDQQIIHEDFGGGSGTYPNDIGLIKFVQPLTLGENISPIALTKTDQTGNKDCFITGWGYTETGGSGSHSVTLQEAQIPVESNEECEGMWAGQINNGNVCVWDGKGSACQGDSGGPLVCDVGGKYELVGVHSWSNSACYPFFFPSVYTRITYFSDWIEENMK